MTALPFRPDVEGLRGLAVLLVVLGLPGTDVLLVVSGFLVTRSLLAELDRTGGVSLPRWYGRRARRILPAAVVVLLAVLAAGRLLGAPPLPAHHFPAVAVAGLSLLVWPAVLVLLLWLGFRWALPWFTGAAVIVSLAAAVVSPAAAVVEISLAGPVWPVVVRAWEPGIGCLLAFAAGRLRRAPAVAAVGSALLVVAGPAWPGPVGAAAVPVLATVAVLAGRADALLGRRPLRWLGRRCYPLWLWHWPVLAFAEQAHGGPLPTGAWAVVVLVTVVLAAATHAALEQPVRRGVVTGAAAMLMIGTPFAVAHAQR